ncbi:hypothetical protein AB0M22_07945 [Nocardia sp. NPDC051756]|uniref:hypothetical protein n=1 Tax=Nocardia sp. NPDC051756 TaxID=3154751 RepID=UPI0034204630
MGTFEEFRQRVTANAERLGLTLRRRNRAPYGFELITEHGDIPASGTLEELDNYVAEQRDNAVSDRYSR